MSLGGFAGGWYVGYHLVKPLERLRAELLAGGISTTSSEHTAGWSIETADLKNAALKHEATLMRKTHEQARESADLKQLLNTVSEGLIQIDDGSRVMQTNPAALRLLGLPPYIRGQSLRSLVRHVDLREIIGRVAAGEAIDAAEVMFDDRQLLISASPISVEGQAGTYGGVIAVADLTQLRRLEGVRRDFVANVSHELKTPLTSIQGYSETLLSDDALEPAERRAFLDVIHRNALRLQRIVDDLLDLSRIESGAWQPELELVDVAEIAREVCAACAAEAERRQVRLVSTNNQVEVIADAHGLRQVISNLVENGLRYTPAGGTVEISAGTSQFDGERERSVEIVVRDTGIGIPREALKRIFERFYRVDPARSRADGGTGLGLSIVKHTMESMNGTVAAESHVGQGTTMIIRLPANV